jgi:uncharacterized membrane protein HdeD (DUF308 family)
MATYAPASPAAGFPLPVHNWGWFLLRGVLALLLGVCAIIFPLSALVAFTIVFGAYAFVDGVASMVAGVRGADAPGSRWGALILRGLIGELVGLFVLLAPLLATVSYAYVSIIMLVAWSIMTGVLEISAAIRLRKAIEGEWLLVLSGALSLLLGLAILVLVVPYPAATILSAAWLIAIYAFAAGVVLVFQAFRLKGKVVHN